MSEPSSSNLPVAEHPAEQNASGWKIYKRLFSYSRRHLTLLIVSMLAFAVYGATQALLAEVLKQFLDALEGATQSDVTAAAVQSITTQAGVAELVADTASKPFYYVPLLVVGLAAVRGTSFFVANSTMINASMRVVNDLRKEVFRHLLVLPSAYYDRRNSAELIALITYNVNQVTTAATDAIRVIFREGFTVIALLTYLLYQNWKLTLVFLLIAPIMASIVVVASRRFRKLSGRMQTSMGNLAHITSESVQGYRLVRSYGGQRYETERFDESSEKNTREGEKFGLVKSLQTPVLQFLLSVALAILMGAVLVMGGSSPSETVAYMVAAGLLARPIRALTEVNGAMQRGLAAAESVFSILDEPAEADHGTLDALQVKGEIELRDVRFRYEGGDRDVLKGVNLKIAAGTTVALVGHSGSGKSTLASVIARFYDIDDGAVLLDGQPVKNISLVALRQHMALVSQQVTLFNCSVAENIAYGDLASRSRSEIIRAAEAAFAREFIEALPEGFDTLIGEDGARLSGGQRQRLAIARAILKDAPVLILDEATSALDTESERAIQSALQNLIKQRTTIIIAHRLSTIEGADCIVVMDDGEIAEMGTHDELLARGGQYARLHAAQMLEV